MHEKKLPELLAPAGTPLALRAALEAGADAIYFGGPTFHARMRAENFTNDTMRDSIALCHAFGAKAYITLNTLLTDRELPQFVAAAKNAQEAGADALIVADLGGAAAIRRAMPDMELHASTQASGHSIYAAKELASLGFSRMVLAREASAEDMAYFTRKCGMETEVFVHGALCVSHSGQCLFSSLVGGRSGNRGECAQPCRLPDKSGKYPLSLKDLSLARHVPELLQMGVHSLKIEGRLKSPEYVRDVVRIWRRLLDERRGATDKEIAELAAIFSRGGFTDGYFTRHVGQDMLGVRSEADKAESRNALPFTALTRRVPLTMRFVMKKDAPISLTATANGKTVTVFGDIPLIAKTAPLDTSAIKEKLTRLGGTPYEAASITVTLDEGLMLPISKINALRRAALTALTAPSGTPMAEISAYVPQKCAGKRPQAPTARFEYAAQIIPDASEYFKEIYLPLDRFAPPANGVVLPAVIFDSERAQVLEMLKNAAKRGAKHALVGNVGHLSLAREAGLVPHGDFRLNVTNSETLRFLLSLGFSDVLLSPELTIPQVRDLTGNADVIIYGRVPLMTLEKCVGKEIGSCTACKQGKNVLVDRRGEKFPVLQLYPHRSIVVNSRPTYMADKTRELVAAGITGGHFIFTTETAQEVKEILHAYKNGAPPKGAVRRI